jgi:hypothetical protein
LTITAAKHHPRTDKVSQSQDKGSFSENQLTCSFPTVLFFPEDASLLAYISLLLAFPKFRYQIKIKEEAKNI